MLETGRERERERERGREGVVRKRVKAEFDKATLFWRVENAAVRTMTHLPSA